MKKIITALAIMATVHFGAEAQTSDCKTVTKHVVHRHKAKTVALANTLGIQGQETIVENCHIIPYQVCKISPDRKSVNCYKTVDPYDEAPLYLGASSTNGLTADMPGLANNASVPTIVISRPAPDYCKRNAANNGTICYTPGDVRQDESGFYHYDFK